MYTLNGMPVGGEILVNSKTAGPQEYAQIAALDDGAFVVFGRTGAGTCTPKPSPPTAARWVDLLCNSLLMQIEGVLPLRWPVSMTFTDAPHIAESRRTSGFLHFCRLQQQHAQRQVPVQS